MSNDSELGDNSSENDGDLSLLSKISKRISKILTKSGKRIRINDDLVYFEEVFRDFIPYACYYDECTLLAKNGELIQNIRISDFCYDANCEAGNLRDLLREVIAEEVANKKISICFHTLRNKKKIDLCHFKGLHRYADDLYDSVSKSCGMDNGYFNDLYITIIHVAEDKRFSLVKIMSDLYFNYVKKTHRSYLEASCKLLYKSTDSILEKLKSFTPKRLSIVKNKGGYVAENLSFLNYLISFENVKIAPPMGDLSRYLLEKVKIAYGFNTMQVMGRIGKKRHAAIMVVKDYVDVSGELIDHLLQIKRRLIVSQSINYTISPEILQEFNKYQEWLDISKSNLSDYMGIREMTEDKYVEKFCEHVISITVIGDDLKELESGVAEVSQALAQIGFVAHRCDVRLEQFFWARIPGNFRFIAKKYNIISKEIGGFTSLHSFATGPMLGGEWGHAVTLLRSIQDNYYFFNFHDSNKIAHTMVIGDGMSNREGLVNYLVTSSLKFGVSLFYIDRGCRSKILFHALGKNYVDMDDLINPFNIEDSEESRGFIASLLEKMHNGKGIKEAELKKVSKIIADSMFKKFEPEKRRLSAVKNTLSKIGGGLDKWCEGGVLGKIFDGSGKVNWDSSIEGIDISSAYLDEQGAKAVFHYVLHYFELYLDTNTPTILVIEDAASISDNFDSYDHFKEWLDRMSNKGVVVIFSFDLGDVNISGEFINWIVRATGSHIIFPLRNVTKQRRAVLDLNDGELDSITSLCIYEDNFLIKQNGRHEILKFDELSCRESAVLSSNEERIEAVSRAMKDVGSKEPEDWLNRYYDIVEEENL